MHTHTFVTGALRTNTYVCFDDYSKKALVIDPGPRSARAVLGFVREHGLKLEMALATHGHFDHVWDLDALRKETKCKVAIGAGDERWLTNPPDLGFPESAGQPRFEPDAFLHEGQVLAFGGVKLTVLATPGHTDGSICLYDAHDGLLFTGDTLFEGARGRTDFPHGNYTEMRASLARLTALPPTTQVLPGHGAKTTIGREKEWIRALLKEAVER